MNSKDIVNRLKRAEGQLRGLQKMVASDTKCDNILIQFNAVRSALDKVGLSIVSQYMKDCIKQDIAEQTDEKHLAKAVKMFLKLK
jgi:DNA-binding FrmR family transcriptional regulator